MELLYAAIVERIVRDGFKQLSDGHPAPMLGPRIVADVLYLDTQVVADACARAAQPAQLPSG